MEIEPMGFVGGEVHKSHAECAGVDTAVRRETYIG
jgi:hypothetical protein